MPTQSPITKAILEHQIQLTPQQKRYIKVKRLCDTIVALLALVVLSPLLLLVGIAIKIESPSEPVFFIQKRVGRNYHVFRLIKFRSMKSTAPKNMATSEFEHPEQYITHLGRIIRRTSIDELPQLVNVLCGDMSLIGPRPLVYTEREIRFLRRWYGVYQVRPGITGLAQVSGRDTVDTYDKVAFDREYVQHISFREDVELFFKSIWIVLMRVGIREGKVQKAQKEPVAQEAVAQPQQTGGSQ